MKLIDFDGLFDALNDDIYYSLTSFLSILSIGACCYIFIYYQELLERDNKIKELETQKKIEYARQFGYPHTCKHISTSYPYACKGCCSSAIKKEACHE